MRILVPLDGSTFAKRALAPAAQILKATQPGTIILLRVAALPNTIGTDLTGATYQTVIEDYVTGIAGAAEAYLHTVARHELADLDVEYAVEIGAPAAKICAHARAAQADLIVMCSHNRNGIMHTLLGSVAEAVAQHAAIPTLFVRPAAPELPDVGRFEPLHILVPLDGQPLAETVLQPAIALARGFHGTIQLLHVLPEHAAPASRRQPGDLAALAYLTRLHDQLEARGITTHRYVAWGDPATAIAREAERHHADIIAIATHGRTGFARLTNGSVAATVPRLTDLPVLLLHPASASPATVATHTIADLAAAETNER